MTMWRAMSVSPSMATLLRNARAAVQGLHAGAFQALLDGARRLLDEGAEAPRSDQQNEMSFASKPSP